MSAQVTTFWHHNEPSDVDQQYDLQLLTIGGVSVLGRWAGEFGEHYVGWALPLGAQRSQLTPYINFNPQHQPKEYHAANYH